MSVDPYAAAIGTVLTGFGYQTVLATEPKYRDYDAQEPTAYVSPVKVQRSSFIAFRTVGNVSVYDIVMVKPNQLDTQLTDNDVFFFKEAVINGFMGTNATLALALPRPWYSRVQDVTAYRKGLLKKGYTVTAIQVSVYWISE